MSKHKEVCQINTEHALHDVLHIVCKYVGGRDLCNMAQVCKSWNGVALQEKAKRCCIYQLHLRFCYFSYMSNIRLISSKLYVVPSTSLLIYDSSFDTSSLWFQSNVERSETLLNYFQQEMPNKKIVLEVDQYLTTTGLQLCRDDLNMLGLFFPSFDDQIQVHVSWCLDSPRYFGQRCNQDELVNHLSEELGFYDCNYPESTILMFTTGGMNDYLVLGELYKRARLNNKDITFALSNGAKIFAANKQSIQQSIMVLRISGPAVESWATYINSYASIFEIQFKLYELKRKVKVGQSCMGMIFGPKCEELDCDHYEHPCGNSNQMMRTIKHTFPDIPFTGLFTKADSNTYTVPADSLFWRLTENDLFRKGHF